MKPMRAASRVEAAVTAPTKEDTALKRPPVIAIAQRGSKIRAKALKTSRERRWQALSEKALILNLLPLLLMNFRAMSAFLLFATMPLLIIRNGMLRAISIQIRLKVFDLY